jgi:hypothetical protein
MGVALSPRSIIRKIARLVESHSRVNWQKGFRLMELLSLICYDDVFVELVGEGSLALAQGLA